MTEHRKRLVAVRYRLLGRADENRAWYKALEALEFAMPFHGGLRKDEVTPEFDHQLSIAQFVMTLPDLIYPVETVAAVFLHDTVEDTDVGVREIEAAFGQLVAGAVWRLTKKSRGVKKPLESYFQEIASCPVASVDKGADNVHNMGTLDSPRPDGSPAFAPEKQLVQAGESEGLVIPMLKEARRRFPQQERAYENMKLILRRDIAKVRAVHG